MNPLFQNAQKPQISPQIVNGIKSYLNTIKMAQNPNLAVSELCQQDPRVKEIMDLCKGRNPKDVFIEKCNELGYDPKDILQLLM